VTCLFARQQSACNSGAARPRVVEEIFIYKSPVFRQHVVGAANMLAASVGTSVLPLQLLLRKTLKIHILRNDCRLAFPVHCMKHQKKVSEGSVAVATGRL
jgi:hypothetical protein